MFTLYQNIDMNVAEDPWLTKAPLKNGGGWCYESSRQKKNNKDASKLSGRRFITEQDAECV